MKLKIDLKKIDVVSMSDNIEAEEEASDVSIEVLNFIKSKNLKYHVINDIKIMI